ncbi:MAG: glycosyltransferase [Cryomorphaceae bacterium]
MKVLSIVNNNVVRDARVQKEARSLMEAGYEVVVVGVQDRLHLPLTESLGGIQVVRIPRTGLYAAIWRLFSQDSPAKASANESNHPKKTSWKLRIKEWWIPFHRERVFANFYAGAAARIRHESPDILHIHDLNALPVLDLLTEVKAKVIYDAHELYTELATLRPSQRRSYQKIESRLIGKADAVITVNQSIATELSERYGIKEPVVVRNCPRTVQKNMKSCIQLREQLAIPSEEKVILFQGGFTKGRGIETLLEAMVGMEGAQLVLMGWGPLEQELKGLSYRLGLPGKAHFIPPVSQDELIAVSAQADIGVIPYQAIGLNNYYTSPNKLFEYIHAGLAIAGSDYPELKRVLNHYQIGELFDPMKAESMRDVLQGMVQDEQKIAAYKLNTVKAATELNWETEAAVLLNTYVELGKR